MAIENAKATFEVGISAVEAQRLVKLSSGKVTHNSASSDDEPIGVSEYYAASGDLVAIRFLSNAGSFAVVAAGAITAGAKVYAAASGKVQALPEDAGTYLRVGTALTAASADGEVIEFLPYVPNETETVSE